MSFSICKKGVAFSIESLGVWNERGGDVIFCSGFAFCAAGCFSEACPESGGGQIGCELEWDAKNYFLADVCYFFGEKCMKIRFYCFNLYLRIF